MNYEELKKIFDKLSVLDKAIMHTIADKWYENVIYEYDQCVVCLKGLGKKEYIVCSICLNKSKTTLPKILDKLKGF